jgi:hypothetical protein
MLRKATARLMLRSTMAAPSIADAVRKAAAKARTAVLTVAGAAAIDYGVFQINTVAGWITGGVLVWFLEYLTESSKDNGDGEKP